MKNALSVCSHCRRNSLRQKEKHCANCRLMLRSKQFVAKQKLSPAAWQRFCKALAIPLECDKLTAKQARAARALLDSFVANHPAAAHEDGLTEYDIQSWLGEYLPANFEPCLTLFGIAGKRATLEGSTDSANGVNSISNTQSNGEPRVETETELSEPNSAERDSAARERKQISANLFLEVAARQGSYCYWCGIRVVREASIPATNRIVKNKTTVVYLHGGELREDAIATIDHLINVADGGDNNPANLVISCLTCNLERDRQMRDFNRPFARRRVPCHSCGARFFHPDWGCCSICGAPPQRQSRILGWLKAIIKQGRKRFNLLN